MMCYFLLYHKENQLSIYIHPLFFRFFSHTDHYSIEYGFLCVYCLLNVHFGCDVLLKIDFAKVFFIWISLKVLLSYCQQNVVCCCLRDGNLSLAYVCVCVLSASSALTGEFFTTEPPVKPHTHMYTHTHTHTHTPLYTHTTLYTPMCTHTHPYTHICTYTHTHTHNEEVIL